jgi:hypothetical protein
MLHRREAETRAYDVRYEPPLKGGGVVPYNRTGRLCTMYDAVRLMYDHGLSYSDRLQKPAHHRRLRVNAPQPPLPPDRTSDRIEAVSGCIACTMRENRTATVRRTVGFIAVSEEMCGFCVLAYALGSVWEAERACSCQRQAPQRYALTCRLRLIAHNANAAGCRESYSVPYTSPRYTTANAAAHQRRS